MSGRTQLLLIFAGVVLARLVFWSALPTAPDDAALNAFVLKDVERDGLRILHSVVEDRTATPDAITAAVRIDAERPARKGYAPVEPRFAVGTPPFDLLQWQRVCELVTGAGGPQLVPHAGLDAEAAGLARLTVLNEMNLPASPANLRVIVRAERIGYQWVLSQSKSRPTSTLVDTLPLQPLEAFSGEVRVLGRAADQERLALLGRRLPAILAGLERGLTQLAAQKMPAAMELLRPGARFVGSFGTRPGRVLLEITELRANETPPQLSALVRNDGGDEERRVFAGRVEPLAATGGLLLRLTAPHSDIRSNAGPLLQDRYDGIELDERADGVELRFTLEGTALVTQGHRFSLRLERAAANATAATAAPAGFGERAAALATAIVPGALYTGTITNRTSGRAERYTLRILSEGDRTLAVLEHPQRAAWRCRFALLLETNRYNAQFGTKPVQLLRVPAPGSDEPPDEMLRSFDAEGPVIPLDIEQDRLVGETANFVYRFSRPTPELAAADAKRRAAQASALRALVAPGMIHAGTVERAGMPAPGAVRLRFVTAGDSDVAESYAAEFRDRVNHPDGVERVHAILYAAEEPRFATPLTGLLRGPDGQIEFQLERPPEWPAGAFTQARAFAASLRDVSLYPERLNLTFDGKALFGAIVRSDGEYRFRFTPASPAESKRWRDEADARVARLRGILKPGTTLEGTLGRVSTTPARVRLRIEQIDESRRTFRAALESALRPGLGATLHGRYERHYRTLTLTLADTPEWPANASSGDPALQRQWDGQLGTGQEFGCYLEADRLVGQNLESSGQVMRLEFALPAAGRN